MIQILDEAFQKTALEGTITLDRAEILHLSLNLSSDCWEGMIGDVVVVWGIEKDGRFVPYNSRDARYTEQIVIGPPQRSHHFATDDILKKGKIHGDGKPKDARSLIQGLLHWIEEALIESGKFGVGAEVICCRQKLLKTEEDA